MNANTEINLKTYLPFLLLPFYVFLCKKTVLLYSDVHPPEQITKIHHDAFARLGYIQTIRFVDGS